MKLSFKLMSIVFLVILVLLVVDGYLSARREIETYENDLRHDTVLLGHALKQLVFEAWQRNGPEHALELIDEVNKHEQQIKIRWVWLDASPNDPFAPRIPTVKLHAVLEGHEAWFKAKQENGSGEICTYVPIKVDDGRPGALEVRESLATLQAYTRHSIVWSATLTALLLLAGGIAVWASGSRFIAIPLKKLKEKTQRIGAGDLSTDLALHGHDELSDLSVAMNRMCEQLSTAQEEIRKETEARIATLEPRFVRFWRCSTQPRAIRRSRSHWLKAAISP
ncbi:MAG: HAMP domain-containing protein [bacterium]